MARIQIIFVLISASRLLNAGKIHYASCCVGAVFPGGDPEKQHTHQEQENCDNDG
jgi:hypothetical protein